MRRSKWHQIVVLGPVYEFKDYQLVHICLNSYECTSSAHFVRVQLTLCEFSSACTSSAHLCANSSGLQSTPTTIFEGACGRHCVSFHLFLERSKKENASAGENGALWRTGSLGMATRSVWAASRGLLFRNHCPTVVAVAREISVYLEFSG